MTWTVVVKAEGHELGRIAYGRDGWAWTCNGRGCGVLVGGGHLSASAALADFEAHVERRHP